MAEDAPDPHRPPTPPFEQVAGQQYVSLTTFRRNGTGVATPVWIAPQTTPDGPRLAVITVDDTGKVKRLRRDPRVELSPCDRRGRVAPGAPLWLGTATVVRDPDGVRGVRDAIGAKYPVSRVGALAQDVWGAVAPARLRLRPRAGIHITLD